MTALRKTTLSLFIIGFCNTQSSIAGTMGPVNTGCTGNRLFAGADGLYLQPRNDDLDYATFLVDNYTKHSIPIWIMTGVLDYTAG
ncbi:hypothetical protein SC407_00620 [Legionella pneumophila serogroup 1]